MDWTDSSNIEQRLREARNLEWRSKVLATCHIDKDGAIVRGYVSPMKCWQCGVPRWNDGTRCKNPTCGARPHPHQSMAGEEFQ